VPKNHPVAHWLGVSFKARGSRVHHMGDSALRALPAQIVSNLPTTKRIKPSPDRRVIRLKALQEQ